MHVSKKRRCPLVLLTTTLFACVCTNKDDGADNDTTGASGDSVATASVSTDTLSQTNSSVTVQTDTSHGTEPDDVTSESVGETSSTDGVSACDHNEWFSCSVAIDCDKLAHGTFGCGRISSYIDESGCPRPRCSEDHGGTLCPDGMRCHDAVAECGRCMGHQPGCEDDMVDGEIRCSCGSSGACDPGWVCVPVDLYPEGYCDP
jgi:hypothetical protein